MELRHLAEEVLGVLSGGAVGGGGTAVRRAVGAPDLRAVGLQVNGCAIVRCLDKLAARVRCSEIDDSATFFW